MTNKPSDEAYADRVVRAAMVAASGGLDPDQVAEVVAKVVEAINKQSEALKRPLHRCRQDDARAHGRIRKLAVSATRGAWEVSAESP